jgi:hypothetical protein
VSAKYIMLMSWYYAFMEPEGLWLSNRLGIGVQVGHMHFPFVGSGSCGLVLTICVGGLSLVVTWWFGRCPW